MLVMVKEDNARIGSMVVGLQGAATVHFVNQRRRNPALFDEIGMGNRPVGIVPHREVRC